MSQPLYGLTPRRMTEVKRLLEDGGAVGGRASGGAEARGFTWVKVTGAAVDGWYPGVVSLDQAGVWEDQEDGPVMVTAGDGPELVEDNRYPCSRTGDDPDTGVARFRTLDGDGWTCLEVLSGAPSCDGDEWTFPTKFIWFKGAVSDTPPPGCS